jgi:hypothetical protein
MDRPLGRRLRELVAAGVLEKQPYREPGQRTRSEYVHTSAGHDLMPVVLGLLQWGAAHVPRRSGAVLTHVGCGADVRTVVRCAAGHSFNAALGLDPGLDAAVLPGVNGARLPVELDVLEDAGFVADVAGGAGTNARRRIISNCHGSSLT